MKSYFLCVNDEQIGPFSLSELRKMGIDNDTPIWKDGYIGWAKAREVDDLKDILPASANPIHALVNTTTRKTGTEHHGFGIRRSLNHLGMGILKAALTGFLFMKRRERSR